MTTPTSFKTIHKHKPGTEIEVFGEYFTFSPDIPSFGTLHTENPLVIDRLRSIPEGFKEIPHEMPLLGASLASAGINSLANVAQQLTAITAEATALTQAAPVETLAPAPAAPVTTDPPAQPPAPVEAPAPAPAPDAPPPPPPPPADTPQPFVLRSPDGQELNLSAMDDEALRKFVVDQKLTIAGKAKSGDKLRQAIVDALTKPAAA